MVTQLNQNTTNLQSILDAVNALPEASNTEIGVSYNADGTQNLIIKDDGSVIEIPDPNPVLLWTNASPTSAFAEQNISISASEYSALLIEFRATTTDAFTVMEMFSFGATNKWVAVNSLTYGNSSLPQRGVTSVNKTSVGFSTAAYGSVGGSKYNDRCIPTRIWGVKFTL